MTPAPRSGALRPPLLFGWNINKPNTGDLLRIIKITESVGVSFVSLNLNSADDGGSDETFVPLCGSDLVLTYDYWSQRIVARVDNIKGSFKAYLEWAAYLGLRAVCIRCELVFHQGDSVTDTHELLANLAQRLKAYLHSPNMPTVCLSFDASNTAWEYWRAIHQMTNYSSQLKVAIIIDEGNTEYLERWIAEPLAAVIIRESLFKKHGDVVSLDPSIIKSLKFLLMYDVKIMLSGSFDFHLLREASELRSNDSLELLSLKDLDVPPMPNGITVKEAIGTIKAIYAAMPPLTEAEKFKQGFYDVLQEPLQPVRDNLETATYENFERCTRKYAQYEAAISAWLKDYLNGKIGSQDENVRQDCGKSKAPVIYIVGAGRGPLVDCSLRALAYHNVEEYSIFALEKNPAAVFALKHKIATNAIKGWDKVQIIFHDMRTLKPTIPADLVLSELLGSFGDNELAPECLDGVQHAFYKAFPNHHVTFMPYSFISYAEPIYAPKVWSTIKQMQVEKHFQQPYIVALNKICKITDGPKPCFKFAHPNEYVTKWKQEDDTFPGMPQGNNDHNNRYMCMTYKANLNCFIHGFAGYFECMLYNDIKISILPGVMDDQISWFPMFFPLISPVYVKESQSIMVHFWRKHDERRVWYEWTLTLPHVTNVHNSNGICHSVLR
ncbi:PRMT5 arginine-N-methyltransferase family protein [Babesia bovis T2Bo]|uniref:Protein arginine N-methyltransferase n=1 Tax=Babesia bovis TaxID=5865 RepID=A7AV47_BABBO|nr:PRMT5 arginine-N-methyltransferase family protein [Babesia bovis T2Bo]EDO05673.1 PRMT5 arginine-N-methyltransferase family protein [Babesia bovis T2Bo]|eukprot:XP_001609241.1 skb1 methyltransferase family protein [Babesia bovis T2Bo]